MAGQLSLGVLNGNPIPIFTCPDLPSGGRRVSVFSLSNVANTRACRNSESAVLTRTADPLRGRQTGVKELRESRGPGAERGGWFAVRCARLTQRVQTEIFGFSR